MDVEYPFRRTPYAATQARMRLCRVDLQRERADAAVISRHLEQLRPTDNPMLRLTLTEVLRTHKDAIERLEAEERSHLDLLQALELEAIEITVELVDAA